MGCPVCSRSSVWCANVTIRQRGRSTSSWKNLHFENACARVTYFLGTCREKSARSKRWWEVLAKWRADYTRLRVYPLLSCAQWILARQGSSITVEISLQKGSFEVARATTVRVTRNILQLECQQLAIAKWLSGWSYGWDRLTKLKYAGLNTVELYVSWNLHEDRFSFDTIITDALSNACKTTRLCL